MKEIIFEKVGDINSTYPYLCIYVKGELNPFMEICVNDDRELEFVFYPTEYIVRLSVDQWEEIEKKARSFLPKVLADEDFFNSSAFNLS